jgi:hypothetical protein
MAKQSKAERSRIEQIKYRAVVNYYGSVPLAQKARGWSEERILKELAIKVPKNMPKLKERPTERQIKTRFTQLEKYKLALEEHTVKEALILRTTSQKKIKSSNEYKQSQKNPLPASAEREKRINLWRKWTKAKALPPFLQKLAERTNQAQIDPFRNRRYDDNDKYGYTAVFYSYTNQQSLSDVRMNLDINPDYNTSPTFGRLQASKRR